MPPLTAPTGREFLYFHAVHEAVRVAGKFRLETNYTYAVWELTDGRFSVGRGCYTPPGAVGRVGSAQMDTSGFLFCDDWRHVFKEMLGATVEVRRSA